MALQILFLTADADKSMLKRNAFLSGSLFAAVCGLLVSATPAAAQPNPSGGDDGIAVPNCMVRFINKTKVPAEAQGKLTELNVEEGMTIKKGDVIAVVDARQAEMALKLKQAEELVARINAQNDINKRDAVATEAIAAAEAETWKELHEKGAAPYWEWRKKKAEADRAKLRIELAEVNEETALAEYLAKQAGTQLSEYEVEMRTIRADFDAFVENRFAQLGEWVQPGSPIVELVQMDRVRVEGYIDALNYAGQVRKGAPVTVTIIVGGSTTEPVTRQYQGQIEYVSTELDLNKRHRIWVSVPNERAGDDWLIKPGMAASMVISVSAGDGVF